MLLLLIQYYIHDSRYTIIIVMYTSDRLWCDDISKRIKNENDLI